MRWVVFLLLLLGALFSLTESTATPILGGVAVLFFLAAMVGLYWEPVSTRSWRVIVIVAAVASLLLYVSYVSMWMIVPIVLDSVLLWGVFVKRWTPQSIRMPAAVRIHPLLNVPVPWVFVLTFLTGAGLQYLLPLTISAEILRIGRIVGIVLTVAGVLLAFWSLGIFRAARTTTVLLKGHHSWSRAVHTGSRAIPCTWA